METCANCGTAIGKLEPAHLWADHVVCAACFRKLAPQAPAVDYARPTRPAPRVQTIEQTGKVWKLQQLLSAALACAGVVMVTIGVQRNDPAHMPVLAVGAGLTLIGLVWFIVARILAWWFHG